MTGHLTETWNGFHHLPWMLTMVYCLLLGLSLIQVFPISLWVYFLSNIVTHFDIWTFTQITTLHAISEHYLFHVLFRKLGVSGFREVWIMWDFLCKNLFCVRSSNSSWTQMHASHYFWPISRCTVLKIILIYTVWEFSDFQYWYREECQYLNNTISMTILLITIKMQNYSLLCKK